MAKTRKIRLPVTTTGRDREGMRVRHAPGTELVLPAEEADALLARYGEYKGAPSVVAPAPAPVKPKGTALADAILSAAAQLDPGNEDHVTGSGKPSVPALEKILGYEITAAERDDAVRLADSRAAG